MNALTSWVFSSWQVIEDPEPDVTAISMRKSSKLTISAALLCLGQDLVVVSSILGSEIHIHASFGLGTGTSSTLLISSMSDILLASLPDLDLEVSDAPSVACFPSETEQIFDVLVTVERDIELAPAPAAAGNVRCCFDSTLLNTLQIVSEVGIPNEVTPMMDQCFLGGFGCENVDPRAILPQLLHFNTVLTKSLACKK